MERRVFCGKKKSLYNAAVCPESVLFAKIHHSPFKMLCLGSIGMDCYMWILSYRDNFTNESQENDHFMVIFLCPL